MGAPSAIRTATERFGPPAARSTAGTTPVRMSVRLRISIINGRAHRGYGRWRQGQPQTRNAAPIPAPGGGGGGGTEMLHGAHVHNDAPAMSSMSANTKGRIVVTSNARLAADNTA